MKKVMPFPPRPSLVKVPGEPLIIFALGRKRVAIQWTVTELHSEPGFRRRLAFLSKEVTDAVGLLTPSAC
jgi:hypothetical protein